MAGGVPGSGQGQNGPLPPVPGATGMGSSMGTMGPSTGPGEQQPLNMSGFGSTGPMSPTSPGMQVPGPSAPSPALSGTGQSAGPVTGNGTGNPMGNAQPPSPLGVSQGAAGTAGGAMPSVGQANKMSVHNPTGTGAVQASMQAANLRPAPGTFPKKKQGMETPMPTNIPGKS